jgi:hypothetical protein
MVTADYQSTLLNHPATLICVVEVPRLLLPCRHRGGLAEEVREAKA